MVFSGPYQLSLFLTVLLPTKNEWIKRIETLQLDCNGVKGRPKKRWREVLKEDMRKKGLCREDAWGQVKMEENVVGRPWARLIPVHWEKQPR